MQREGPAVLFAQYCTGVVGKRGWACKHGKVPVVLMDGVLVCALAFVVLVRCRSSAQACQALRSNLRNR